MCQIGSGDFWVVVRTHAGPIVGAKPSGIHPESVYMELS